MEHITEASVQQDIDTYLPNILRNTSIVIGVLRYGAHLPHLWQQLDEENTPVSIVLSHMVEFLPDDVFVGKNFLVLDDTIYRGRQMQAHVQKLIDLGASRDRVDSAAVVVHEESTFRPSIRPLRTYDEEHYIKWKTHFSSLVRSQRRSIDRDHPLYFFKIDKIRSGTILSILERFGHVSTATDGQCGKIYSFAVTIRTDLLNKGIFGPFRLKDYPGLELADVSKVRLYWELDENGCAEVTVVPIIFATLDFCQFFSSGDEARFHRLTGISLSALEYLRNRQEAWQRFTFFLASRAVAAGLLIQFIEEFAERVRETGASIKSVNPEEQDYPIQNIFPGAYVDFHAAVRSRIQLVLEQGTSTSMPMAFPWPTPTDGESLTVRLTRPMIPEKYSVLDVVTRDHDAAIFDGQRWVPNEVARTAATFAMLRSHMSSSVALSVALDDLLDAGLLRAKDSPISSVGPQYARGFLPGGEYNALQVSRIVRNWREANPQPDLPSEVALDDWFDE